MTAFPGRAAHPGGMTHHQTRLRVAAWARGDGYAKGARAPEDGLCCEPA